MEIIRIPYKNKGFSIAIVRANFIERFFINRKIKKRKCGVIPTNRSSGMLSIIARNRKIDYYMLPLSVDNLNYLSNENKSDYLKSIGFK